jgi:hypothetical protein
MLKVPEELTVMDTPNVRVRPPPTPWTVMLNVPVGVVLLVTIVSVEVTEPLAGGVTVWLGLNPVPANTWLPGRFSTAKLTALLNPLILWTVIEYVVVCP